MKALLWLILLAICWPLALVVLVLAPIIWLVTIPFRIIGFTMEGVLGLIRAILFLPARILGASPRPPRF